MERHKMSKYFKLLFTLIKMRDIKWVSRFFLFPSETRFTQLKIAITEEKKIIISILQTYL